VHLQIRLRQDPEAGFGGVPYASGAETFPCIFVGPGSSLYSGGMRMMVTCAKILSGEQISELAASLSKDVFAPSHPMFVKDAIVDKVIITPEFWAARSHLIISLLRGRLCSSKKGPYV
jgi:hypothetical protein